MHPLEAQIRAIRRRLRWWLVVEGLARLTVWVLGGGLLLGATDYWFRFQEPGLRLLGSLGFFSLVGWGLYQLARSPAWKRIPEVALALQLERCFPLLADRLASSVALLRQPAEDPTAGSPVLRQVLIAQTAQQAAGIDFRTALDPRPILRAVLGAGAIGLVAAGWALVEPNALRIALLRLVMPFSETAWPQRTHLILVHRVERIARGQPFVVLVEEAQGNLPADLRIHYRLQTPEGIQEQTEPVRRITIRTEQGQWTQLGQARREGLLQPFWYRLTGGDDTSMDWIRVEILDPPSLVHCQVRLVPPEYTGLPSETAGQWIRALVGTRVEITGRADRPLQAVWFIDEQQQEHPGQILNDGSSFQIGVPFQGGPAQSKHVSEASSGSSAPRLRAERSPLAGPARSGQQEAGVSPAGRMGEIGPGLIIRQSGRWRLRLIDQEGLDHEAASWQVQAVPDQPPSLTVQWPPLLSYATATARLTLRANVKDDLGIRKVVLLATVRESSEMNVMGMSAPVPGSSTDGPPETLAGGFRQWVLYEGPESAPKQPNPFSAGGSLRPNLPPVEYAWDLTPLEAKPGNQILFYLQAADYAGQTASSQIHRIMLLRPEQLLDRLTAQHHALLAELEQWLQKQRSVHNQLADLEKGFAEGQPLGQRQVDRLRSLELGQRQLHDQLAQSPENILLRLERHLADLQQNHLQQTDLQRRLEYLRSGLVRLEKEHLLIIAQEFVHAIKAAQAALDAQTPEKPFPPPPPLRDSVRQVLVHQEGVIRSLESWLRRFQPDLQTQRFSQELAQLIRDQKALLDQIGQIAQSTLTKELRELGPQELADLRSAAQRQTDLARRTEALQQEMADVVAQLQSLDPVSGQLLAEAVRYAEQAAPAARMAAAAQDIQQNRMGRLLQVLPEILRHLEHLADLLANRQDQTSSRLTPLLHQAEQALADCIQKQQEIQNLFELASRTKPKDQPPLLQQAGDEQQALIGQGEKLLKEMEELWAAQPAQAMRSALAAMDQTVHSARQGELAQAIQASQAALQALQQARWLLAQERLQTQSALLGQQLAQLREALPSLQKKQEEIWKETVRLENVRKDTGTFNPQDAVRLADLASQQQEISRQTHTWAEKLAELTVLQMALTEAARWMEQAAQQLAQTQAGPAAQQAQQEALAQLRMLQEALAQEPSAAPLAKPIPSQSPQPPGSSDARKVVSAAELRVLRLWQQSIHQRTARFYQQFGEHPPDRPEVQAEYQALRQAQARLAQMVQQLLQPPSSQERKP